jgi:FSR family fosmidomycin resistance protein-like MFS transporter
MFTLLDDSQMKVGDFLPYILIYNFIAFALQAPVGFLVDYSQRPREGAALSFLILVGAILLMPLSIIFSVIFFGVGNALYHAAGGSIALNIVPFKTTAPGIFVAPGAIGVLMGGIIGRYDGMNEFGFILVLLVMAFVIWQTEVGEAALNLQKSVSKPKLIYLALVLIFTVVICRALIGTTSNMPWRSSIVLLTIFTIFVSLGKGMGGYLADRFGWMKIGFFGLLASAPLLLFFSTIPWIGILGAFLFQFTMAITLVSTYKVFPTRPAFAFGLPCLALFIGALPALLGRKELFTDIEIGILMFVVAVVCLYFGLRIVLKNKQNIL